MGGCLSCGGGGGGGDNHHPPVLHHPEHHSEAHLARPSNSSQGPLRPTESNLKTKPNKPLKLHVWSSEPRLYTRGELDRERNEFFETRTAGHPEVWLAIKTALEMLWSDADGGLELAQAIVNAAGISVPRGDLHPGVYDSQGAYYELPEYVVADPTNIEESEDDLNDFNVVCQLCGERFESHGELLTHTHEVHELDEESDGKDTRVGSHHKSEEELNEAQRLRRQREERGKAVSNPADIIDVRVRLSGGQDLVVSIDRNASVRLLSRCVLEDGGFSSENRIKIVYLGKVLQEHKSLIEQGWKEKDKHIVNAMVFS